MLLAAGLAAGAGYGVTRWLGARALANPQRAPSAGAPRVVILGAGFGGLTTAIELGRLARSERGSSLDVTLIDRINYHLFTPMLYQVATGLLEPGNVTYPTRALARRFGFRFREGCVEGIDLGSREVLVSGARLPYDFLVIALGSVTNTFGIASVEEHAAGLKTLADAVEIRNRVVTAFERAEVTDDPAERRAWLTFVVVGGGATGIELTASLHTLIQKGLLPDYPGVRPDEVRVLLVEAGPSLLGGMDPWLGEAARRRLEAKGIEVLLGKPAADVSEAGITLKDGTHLPARAVVWAAGVRPSGLSAALPVDKGRDGRLIVDTYLRLPSHPEVFALGDCAWFAVPEQDGRPAPPNAQTAVHQAPVVARNIVALVRGAPLERYEYANKGNLVALGQGDGVGLIGSVRLEGFPAWVTWRGFYLSQLMGFKNRLGVLVEWTSAYFLQRSTAHLDVGGAAWPPGASDHPPPAPAATTPGVKTTASYEHRGRGQAAEREPARPRGRSARVPSSEIAEGADASPTADAPVESREAPAREAGRAGAEDAARPGGPTGRRSTR